MRTTSFTIAEVDQQRLDASRDWREFLNVPSLSMGVYHVAAGSDDRATHRPHDRDEVYVGVRGQGRLTADDQEYLIQAGVIVYVQAGVPHHFHDVTDDLTMLVFFSAAERTGDSK